jgi:hypothetical protein
MKVTLFKAQEAANVLWSLATLDHIATPELVRVTLLNIRNVTLNIMFLPSTS